MKRSEQRVIQSIDASPEAAWEIISAITGVEKWFAPMITSSRLEGDKRVCSTEGGEFTEDIILVDHDNMEFKYGIPQQHMMPVENILGSMKVVSGNDEGAAIEWHWTFDVSEENEAAAKEMLAGAGAMGISGIDTLARSN